MCASKIDMLNKFSMIFSNANITAHIKRMLSCSTDKDGQEFLRGVDTIGDVQISSDGFCVLAIKSEKEHQAEFQGNNLYEVNGKVIVYQENTGSVFDSVSRVFPKKPPIFTITISPKLLIQVLRNFDLDGYTGVEFHFWDEKSPFEMAGFEAGSENSKVYALIMPMHSSGEFDISWIKNIKS